MGQVLDINKTVRNTNRPILRAMEHDGGYDPGSTGWRRIQLRLVFWTFLTSID